MQGKKTFKDEKELLFSLSAHVPEHNFYCRLKQQLDLYLRKYMRDKPKKSVSMAIAMEREQRHACIFSYWLTPVACPQSKKKHCRLI